MDVVAGQIDAKRIPEVRRYGQSETSHDTLSIRESVIGMLMSSRKG